KLEHLAKVAAAIQDVAAWGVDLLAGERLFGLRDALEPVARLLVRAREFALPGHGQPLWPPRSPPEHLVGHAQRVPVLADDDGVLDVEALASASLVADLAQIGGGRALEAEARAIDGD